MKWAKPRGLILIINLALVVFLGGLLSVLIFNAAQFNNHAKQNLAFTVYYESNLDDDQAKLINDSISTMPFVKEISFKSKDEAAFDFQDEIGEDFIDILGGNPLAASSMVTIKSTFSNEVGLAEIHHNLKQVDGVLDVTYLQKLFHIIDRNSRMIGIWVSSLTLVFIIVAIFIISTTVRLLLYGDRFNIKNQQLVGATNRFILKPYVFKSIGWTIISYVLGIALLLAMLWLIFTRLDYKIDLNNVELIKHFSEKWFEYVLILFLLLMATAAVVICTTVYTTRKYLRTPIDNLYK